MKTKFSTPILVVTLCGIGLFGLDHCEVAGALVMGIAGIMYVSGRPR